MTYLCNPYTQRICGCDKQLFERGTCRTKYKCLYVYHLQCVVSNGETTSLVLVKGCANIGLLQKSKEKNLTKTVGINLSNFEIDEECIRLNTSSSVNLTFEVTNIQVII